MKISGYSIVVIHIVANDKSSERNRLPAPKLYVRIKRLSKGH